MAPSEGTAEGTRPGNSSPGRNGVAGAGRPQAAAVEGTLTVAIVTPVR